MTQQAPTGDSQTQLDDDLDNLLDDEPATEDDTSNEPSEQITADAAPAAAVAETPVPLEHIDAMLANRADEEEYGSIDDLLGDDDDDDENDADEEAKPGYPGEDVEPTADVDATVSFPEVASGPPLAPAPTPEEIAVMHGADSTAVAGELDANLAEQDAMASASDAVPKSRRGRAAVARLVRLAKRVQPRHVIVKVRRLCATINRPVGNLPPDIRNMIGYAGLVTIFMAALLVVGKIAWVLFFAA